MEGWMEKHVKKTSKCNLQSFGLFFHLQKINCFINMYRFIGLVAFPSIITCFSSFHCKMGSWVLGMYEQIRIALFSVAQLQSLRVSLSAFPAQS